MIPLIRLKHDVQVNGELTKVVDVLKGIAAARHQVLERALTSCERHLAAAREFLALLPLERLAHPFVHPRSQTAGILVVTSDAGFLGGLNTRVVSRGIAAGGADGVFTIIGERGAGLLRDARCSFTAFPGIEDAQRLAQADAVRDHLVRQVLNGVCGSVVVVYPRPVSFAVQEVAVEPLLPCTAWAPPPAAGPEGAPAAPWLWESRPADVVEYVVTQVLAHRLGQIFALSRLAELAARTIHLEGSYQELTRQGKRLRLQYFRARHEVIDRSIREIVVAQRVSIHVAAA